MDSPAWTPMDRRRERRSGVIRLLRTNNCERSEVPHDSCAPERNTGGFQVYVHSNEHPHTQPGILFITTNQEASVVKSIVVLLAFLFSGMRQEGGRAYEPIGPLHREIADTSPVAALTIRQVIPRDPGYLTKAKFEIKATLRNLTEHQLTYVNPQLVFDARNSATGESAPDTPTGCYANFFSKCYTPSAPWGMLSTGPPKHVVPPNGEFEIVPPEFIDQYYQLAPGKYDVVGIFCATQREGPECFRSNKITIAVSPEEKDGQE
jgi:hypothetical protein